ncbi:serine hydrolase domain-containing protein [Rariglobus hedericola]|uniref:Beta-lactamase family protein n=1 Tax=Rariglobus hedericola TaxID=2597822 RepID=A0A556QP42_9BACT|nr:serine hydrolase domain-containing protein [Rariglobus hedericola]TSJ78416.1 beta-lactamase family protein [Rariglobus hedericola]
MSSPQTRIESLLRELVADGSERGLQVAVYHRGRLVVDAVAGVMSRAPDAPSVTADTLFPVFSTGKGVTATAAHLLVERGLTTYETPVAAVWPEFAAHGKGGITLRHLLDHTAGLSAVPAEIDHEQSLDWDQVCAALAAARPATAPGTHLAYHAMTYGWLVGEFIRRVDGRSFPRFVREEISGPLGIDDGMYFGLPDSESPHVATLEQQPPASAEPPPPPSPTVPQWRGLLHNWMNQPDVRRACMPASNGIMNARAIARHYAALLPGGVDGVELLPPARIREATTLQLPRPEIPPGNVFLFTLGYMQGGPAIDIGPEESAFGHGGYGGSQGYANPARGFAVGITKNRFRDGDTTPARILSTLIDCIAL